MTDQLDFFNADPLVTAPSFRDDRDLMWYPYFALEKGRKKPIDWRDDKAGLTVRLTGADYGIATEWDSDILICFRTMMVRRLNQGLPPSRSLVYAPHDLMVTMGAGTGRTNYQRHFAALDRLKHTGITSIYDKRPDGDGGLLEARTATSWIDSYQIIQRESARGQVSAGVRVTLSEWTYEMLKVQNRSLAVSPELFNIPGAIERRLYKFAEKGAGAQGMFWSKVSNLHARMNSQTELRKFNHKLREIVERNDLPKFTLELSDTSPSTVLNNVLNKRGLGEKGPFLIARLRPAR